MRHFMLIVIISLVLLSAACTPTQGLPVEATPQAPTTNPPPSQTPEPLPSATPSPPTATATPEVLHAQPPYFLFGGDSGLWLANPDGGQLTQISKVAADSQDLHAAVAPAGDRLVQVVGSATGFDLVETTIPAGSSRVLAHLTDVTDEEAAMNPTSAKAFTVYALRDYPSFAWQPGDGRYLAFTAAFESTSTDLYLYDFQTGQVTRLEKGSNQTIAPVWSEDGAYVLYFEVSWNPPFGGAIVGYNRMNAVRAVRVSDGQVINQPVMVGTHLNFVGWATESHYLIFDSDETCYAKNLRFVNVADGKAEVFAPYSFYYQVFLTANNSLVFSAAAGCETSPGDGLFLLPWGAREPVKLWEKKSYELNYLPESSVVQAYPEVLVKTSHDGTVLYTPPVYDHSYHPAVSVQDYQAWHVIENRQGRVMVRQGEGEWTKIADGMVDTLMWDPINGDTLLIGMKDGSIYRAQAPGFEVELIGNLGGRLRQSIWVK